jgi:pyruvate kinase
MNKTGIVCTIGPASRDETVLRKMIFSGMEIARLNFSHGSLKEHKKSIDTIRRLNKKYKRHIKILMDLEGFRVRIGKLQKPVELNKNMIVVLTNKRASGRDDVIPFDYDGDLRDIKKGNFFYIDDGNIALEIISVQNGNLTAKVVIPGIVKEHKGINIPDVNLRFTGMTSKDKEDIRFGIKEKVDYIAQSFVRDEKDILPIRKMIVNKLPECRIIAKIENRQGINNIGKIIEVSDGIMVARGDMGVSLPIWEVPLRQKEIIMACRRARKMSITATQMLESMVENKRPTRAEVTDVANAVLDGSDYVMLSEESAAGKYPVEAVKMMHNIISFTESSWLFR